MDYEKKYKEALEKARQLCLYPTTKPFISDLKNLFPELAESEDEKIRESLLEYLHTLPNHYSHDGVCAPEWIAWLEKQGEQKPAEWHREDEQNLNACFGFIPDEFLRKWLNDIIHVKYDKSSDKVVPKFKVGDWVVQENIGVYKVIEVCESWYEVVDNKDKNYSIGFDKEYMCHLWTIQDAKDGDVLAVEPIKDCPDSFIAIYKERGLNFFNSYCFVSLDGKFNKGTTGHDIYLIHPATKEQRDILFAKMTEAGYEWDSEKKELRETEQIQALDYPDNLPKDNWELVHEFVEKFGRIPEDEDELNVLVEYVLKRQKSAWSKEDEDNFIGIDNYLACSDSPEGFETWIDWLKSIKQRIEG